LSVIFLLATIDMRTTFIVFSNGNSYLVLQY